MAVENIGNLVPTKIPALIDDANIQDALKAYHYGSYDFDTAETNTANLLNPSIAYTITNLQTQITTKAALEVSARDISRATTTAPTAAAFTAPASTNYLTIGSNSARTTFWNGQIGPVLFYNTLQTLAGVGQVYDYFSPTYK